MSQAKTFRQRVLAGETTFGIFLVLDSPASVEICARSGLDWVLIDLEHGLATEATLVPLLMATKETPATVLVRVESAARPRIGRVLDMGAEGVMVPQVHSAIEARAVARWLRTQPGGERGVALFTRGMDYGGRGHLGAASRHEEILGIVQVESAAALSEVEETAGVEGVDVLFVGPTDLSHALGIPGRIEEPLYDEAIRRVASAARGAGKAAGVLVWRPEDIARYAGLGYTFFGLSSEGLILDRALRSALDGAREAARLGAGALGAPA